MTDTTLRGAESPIVRDALERADPLPGTAGFAGEIDGRLVRDVLGRVPLFVELETSLSRAGPSWAFEPTVLENPVLFPAGAVAAVDSPVPDAESRWALPDPAPVSDHEAAIDDLEGAIETATAGVRQDDRDIAVAFSGGVDSALVAELLDAPLYVSASPTATTSRPRGRPPMRWGATSRSSTSSRPTSSAPFRR